MHHLSFKKSDMLYVWICSWIGIRAFAFLHYCIFPVVQRCLFSFLRLLLREVTSSFLFHLLFHLSALLFSSQKRKNLSNRLYAAVELYSFISVFVL